MNCGCYCYKQISLHITQLQLQENLPCFVNQVTLFDILSTL